MKLETMCRARRSIPLTSSYCPRSKRRQRWPEGAEKATRSSRGCGAAAAGNRSNGAALGPQIRGEHFSVFGAECSRRQTEPLVDLAVHVASAVGTVPGSQIMSQLMDGRGSQPQRHVAIARTP